MNAARTRVVVVDDSMTSRALLVELCRSHPSMEVVGEGRNGLEALELVRSLRPSIVVMDIEMPVMDGFEATRRIMAEMPTPILIVTAQHDVRDVEISLRAVHMGALTVAAKPPGPSAPDFRSRTHHLLSLITALAEVQVLRRRISRDPPGAVLPAPVVPARSRPVRAVGVGASTGGPAALYRFLEALPAAIDVPILVVQHIADGFVPGLVSWLRSASPLSIKVAEQGESLVGGLVYVAPGQRHLEVTSGGSVALSDAPPESGFRPSASVLFRSLAHSCGSAAAAVVLTGMGDDGLEGVRAVSDAGGAVLVQDADTSVVFGMPRAVTNAGLATVVAPVEHLAQAVGALAGSRRKGRREQIAWKHEPAPERRDE